MFRKGLAILVFALAAAGPRPAAFAADADRGLADREQPRNESGRRRYGRAFRDGRREGEGFHRNNPERRRQGRDFRDGWREGADCRRNGPGPLGRLDARPCFLSPAMLEELALDAGQKGKIIDLLTADYKSRLDIRLEIQELYKKLGELRDDPEAASDAIVSANAALGEARGRLEAAARRTAREVRAILTPEQQRMLEEEAPRGCGGRWP